MEKDKDDSTFAGTNNVAIFRSLEDEPNLELHHSERALSTYQTDVKDEEWQGVYDIFTICNNPLLSLLPSRKEALIKAYKQTFDSYHTAYKLIKNGGRNYFKKLRDNKTLFYEPLFQFATDFEDIYDDIRTQYKKNSEERVLLEDIIFPVVQKTFNLCMRTHEKLTQATPLTLGTLNYFGQQKSTKKLKHLYFKRDKNGFLLFSLFPHEKLKDNYFESYIPYKHSKETEGEHCIIFKEVPSSNTLKIIQQPGLLVNWKGEDILINFYTGKDGKFPYTTESKAHLLTSKTTETWLKGELFLDDLQKLASEEKELESTYEQVRESFKRLEEIAPDYLLETDIVVSNLSESAEIDENKFFNFAKTFLGNDKKAFIPFPKTALEQKECEYLIFLSCYEKIQTHELSEGDLYLLEYLQDEELTENNLKERLTEVIKEYEETLLEDYQRKEEAHNLKQEWPRAKIKNTDYQKQKIAPHHEEKKLGKRQGKPLPKCQKPAQNSLSQDNNERINNVSERLEQLKNGKRRLKFRTYIKMINVITQEMAKQGSTITGYLNKSSHGKFKTEDSKTTTVVRPHGKHDTVPPKGAKKSLNSLFNTFLSGQSDKK